MGIYVVPFAGGDVVFVAVRFEGAAEVLAVVFDEDVEFVVAFTVIVAFDVVVFVGSVSFKV